MGFTEERPVGAIQLEVRNRRQWRAWLKKHHASSAGVWLVFHKAHTGVNRLSSEALERIGAGVDVKAAESTRMPSPMRSSLWGVQRLAVVCELGQRD